jgi:hypothetical protein
MAAVDVLAPAVEEEEPHFVLQQEEKQEEQEQEEQDEELAMEDAYDRLQTLWATDHSFLREDFLSRMEPTIRQALGRVEDDQTEYSFQTLAMMNLAAHLCGRQVYRHLVDGLNLLGGVFLTDTNEILPEDDLESTLSLLQHLQNRLYPSESNAQNRRFHQMNTRAYPFLVAVTAQAVSQTASNWAEVVATTKQIIQSSFYMDPHTVRVGLALFGLQRIKANQVPEGLTITQVLEDLSQRL